MFQAVPITKNAVGVKWTKPIRYTHNVAICRGMASHCILYAMTLFIIIYSLSFPYIPNLTCIQIPPKFQTKENIKNF